MKVTNVHSNAVYGTFVMERCMMANCCNKVASMLAFNCDTMHLYSVFAGKAIHSNNYNTCGVVACVDHVRYLELLGYVMVVNNDMTSQLFQSVINTSASALTTCVNDYRGYMRARQIVKLAMSEDGVSRNEICDLLKRVLRTFVVDTYYQLCPNDANYYKTLALIESSYIDEHFTDVITLFIELKRSNIKISNENSVAYEVVSGANDKLIDVVLRSKLLHNIRIRTRI